MRLVGCNPNSCSVEDVPALIHFPGDVGVPYMVVAQRKTPMKPSSKSKHQVPAIKRCQFHPFSRFVWKHMVINQYLYIPFLGGWTSIYQLFWGSPGVQGFWPIPIWKNISKRFLNARSGSSTGTPLAAPSPGWVKAVPWLIADLNQMMDLGSFNSQYIYIHIIYICVLSVTITKKIGGVAPYYPHKNWASSGLGIGDLGTRSTDIQAAQVELATQPRENRGLSQACGGEWRLRAGAKTQAARAGGTWPKSFMDLHDHFR